MNTYHQGQLKAKLFLTLNLHWTFFFHSGCGKPTKRGPFFPKISNFENNQYTKQDFELPKHVKCIFDGSSTCLHFFTKLGYGWFSVGISKDMPGYNSHDLL